MKTTGVEILAFLSEMGIDVFSPRFTYDGLTDVQKDTVVRWFIRREPADYGAEIIPGAGEWGNELTHLFLSDPLRYMERLRRKLSHECATRGEMEERLTTEATLAAGISAHMMRLELWNDQWEFYQNAVDAAINYLNRSIDRAVHDELPRFQRIQQSA